MKITAHRGGSSLAPENTLAAFNKAAELGCEWIEIDVQLSIDEVPVVIHDQTVERCTDGSGAVSSMTLDSLKSLDAGLWFGEEFRDERIPTLEETLLLARNTNLNVNIEIKLYRQDDLVLLCEKIKKVIIDLDVEASQILFSSFNIEALKYMQYHQPQIRRGLLVETIPANVLLLLAEIEAYSLHCNYVFLKEQQAKLIKKSGYQLYCYTPNSPQQVSQHWDWGVDMMITDVPQAYINILTYDKFKLINSN
ncbi:Glycerophosphodiester phosphodiesterase [Psychromonas ingrahamii 37]|uniref:Glycerophosphodiester phosphodiesterase n=1 Tax=Psychromonas ingrahamii (strain DSM 17664 / CCUG 51855 / 37) TaxID=357804 RepID=A1SWH5_PSYIN|nr:glycerophosphoryl diester phosphodiesterase [Psychromonas ingrahamii]ABM03840.1 Glycerophosphodiester phosphodiesterase [Psychromonas ingrahamii 37]